MTGRLEAAGFGPAWVWHDGGQIRVLVGRCEFLPDALLLKKALRASGFSDAFEKAVPLSTLPSGAQFEWNRPEASAFVSSPETTLPSSRNQQAEAPEFVQVEELEEVVNALGSGDQRAITTSAGLTESLPKSDPVRGWVQTRLAGALVARDGRAKPHLPLIMEVASGAVAAPPEARLEAEWMAADALHYYLHKPLEAYSAYSEILEKHGKDDGVRARALVERSACLLELARMKQAYFNEVRRSCRQIMETVPSGYARAHAVADLMYCESIVYDGKPEEALKAFDGFERRHPGRLRETAKTLEWRGYLYGQLGQLDKAEKSYRELLAMDLSDPREQFFWDGSFKDPRQSAAEWLKYRGLESTNGTSPVRPSTRPRQSAARASVNLEQPAYQVEVLLEVLRQARAKGSTGGKAALVPRGTPDFDPAFPHALYQEIQ